VQTQSGRLRACADNDRDDDGDADWSQRSALLAHPLAVQRQRFSLARARLGTGLKLASRGGFRARDRRHQQGR
jgi:hypothetical protein